MGEGTKKQYGGYWRRRVNESTTTGHPWTALPGVFPAGGDEPSEDPAVIAAALCKRAQITNDEDGKPLQIEVRIYRTDTAPIVRLEVVPTIEYRKTT